VFALLCSAAANAKAVDIYKYTIMAINTAGDLKRYEVHSSVIRLLVLLVISLL
jgi:hypothetical protein